MMRQHVGQVLQWVVRIWCFLLLIQLAKEGQFRRLWNWPMRVSVVCLSLGALLEWPGAWISKHWATGNAFGKGVAGATDFVFTLGFVSLCVFLVGFLMTMVRDFRPGGPYTQVSEAIDQVQNLLA